MALVPVRPAWPTGLLDSLKTSKSIHGQALGLPISLQSRRRSSCPQKKVNCSSPHVNVKNSEHPSNENAEKKPARFGYSRKNPNQNWAARPNVERYKYPWEKQEQEGGGGGGGGVEVAPTTLNSKDQSIVMAEKKKVFYSPSGHTSTLPTASWMQGWNKSPKKGPQKLIQPAVDYTVGESSSESETDEAISITGHNEAIENELLHLEGPREKTAMEQITTKLRKFGYIEGGRKQEPEPEPGSVEDIFHAEPGILPNTRGGYDIEGSWSTPYRVPDALLPWERREENVQEKNVDRERIVRTPTLAELTIPEPELNRLRGRGIRLKERIKLGSAGVTRRIVDTVHEKWKTSEIVKFKCEGSSAMNMKRTHDFLERRTGGLVIWRSGGSVVLYRGLNYEPPSVKSARLQSENNQGVALDHGGCMLYEAKTVSVNKPIGGVDGSNTDGTLIRDKAADMVNDDHLSSSHLGRDSIDKKQPVPPIGEADYENEIDKILDGLGPRFTYWSGSGPLPVDADLLPAVVPGYKQPFRLLPYGMRPTLGNQEMTKLRKLARKIPPHFALGRNKNHQGLAAAMVKLWERSAIAKIAVKRGVQNTSNERMAEEIKRLTGGALLSRNKEFIVFFRGKDFLSPAVSAALVEREALTKALQDEEERARVKASSTIPVVTEEVEAGHSIAGTLSESLEAKARWSKHIDSEELEKMKLAAAKARKDEIVRKLERRLSVAQFKVAKAEKALAKVEAFLSPAKPASDKETITDEERFMFRKLGLRMQAFLLLGRRGIFDGTVENMHLHWKHRELVKIISKERSLAEVKYTALMLESESGGILVSVDKVSKGYAIIVYRGKNYQRPLTIKPKNLLTKRKALQRSKELQRREALNRHILQLERITEQLKYDLSRTESVEENQGSEALNAELDLLSPSKDVESEVEANLDSYNGYSEDLSSDIKSEIDQIGNSETGKESAAFSKSPGMNFEGYLTDFNEVEEEEPHEFQPAQRDMWTNSAAIDELHERDASYSEP